MIYSILLSILLSLSSCNKSEDISTPSQSTQQAFINGQIYTVNDKLPWAEAMIVTEGIITAVGTNQEI